MIARGMSDARRMQPNRPDEAGYAGVGLTFGRVPLVLDGPASATSLLQVEEAVPHTSSIPGVIYATRRAAAVVGVDSGPLHIAAALGKPGIAIFGPTDPARNGPYGDSLRVLRTPEAATTYRRGGAFDENMIRISPDEVFEALRTVLRERRPVPIA